MTDHDDRISTLEISMRQIMRETGVSCTADGQPLYNGAYASGFEKSVRRVARPLVMSEDKAFFAGGIVGFLLALITVWLTWLVTR